MSENSIYYIVFGIYLAVLIPDFVRLFGLIKSPRLVVNGEKYFVKLNSVILFFTTALLVLLITFEVNIFNYSSPIEYSSHQKISLKDFNGFKIPGQSLQGSNRFAFIKTSIEYEYRSTEVEVRSLFHPARSYVYIDDLESPELLNHELYHFHITELHSRIFREKLSIFETQLHKDDVRDIYEVMKSDVQDMQRAYDYETDHGYLLGKQLAWQEKVDSLLNFYSDYENTIVESYNAVLF